MHTFKVTSGEWFHNGKLITKGYAGTDDGDGVTEPGEGRNDPSMERVRNVGPLPRGGYGIGVPYDSTHGSITMRLYPKPGTNTYGRGGFLIHADMKDPKLRGRASHGCIVLPREAREYIANSQDHDLEVVA